MRILGVYDSLGYQQLTCAGATALTVPKGARFALVTVEGQNVRWRSDGTNPTAAIGNRILKDQPAELIGGDLTAVKFIEESATAKVNVNYGR